MDVRNFQKPKKTGTSVKGPVTPSTTPEVTPEDKQEEQHTTEQPRETTAEIIDEYLRYLKKEDITEDQILQVLDSIVTTGNIYWNFELFNKIPVTFKIRPTWVNTKLSEKIDRVQPKTFSRFSEIVGLYNLAGSLVEYNGTNIDVQSESDFNRNLEFVNNLPFIVQSHLIKKMSIFDRVVSVATSDRFIENFTKPQSAKSE